MDGNGMKGLIVMIMLSLTLFVVLVHVEDRPFPFFSRPLQPFLHPFPLTTRLLSFSSHDDAKSWKKKTPQRSRGSKSQKKTSLEDSGSKSQKNTTLEERSGSGALTKESRKEFRKCCRRCRDKALKLKSSPHYAPTLLEKCIQDCRDSLGLW